MTAIKAHVPTALVQSYCHWLEMVMVNLTSFYSGPLLINCHIIVVYMWLVIGSVGSLHHHSGYKWPFSSGPSFTPQPEFHDFHHSVNKGNYGLLGVCDYIFGTDQAWRKQRNQNKNE